MTREWRKIRTHAINYKIESETAYALGAIGLPDVPAMVSRVWKRIREIIRIEEQIP